MALTAFGCAFIVSRLLFVRSVARHGGLPVSAVFIAIELAGLAIMASASSAHLAVAGAAAELRRLAAAGKAGERRSRR